jgi:hypothetical protein
MQIPFAINTISTHCRDDWRDGIKRLCVCSHKTWNPTSLTMEAKKSWIASCLTTHFTLWAHKSRCILVRFMAWPHMHWKRPWVVGWGRFNLVRNVEDKISKAILKDGMVKRVESQAFKLGLHKISTECNNNLKTILKWSWKMSVRAHSVRCFPEDNLLLSLIVIQMVGWQFE